MTEQTKKRTAMMAGVAGAVVGAGVAVAATKVMSDKKLRDKVTNTFSDFKDQVMNILDEAANEKQIDQKGGSASRQLNSSKKSQGKSNTSQKGQDSKSQDNKSESETYKESPDLSM